jgi:uncharacterized membrane protein
MTSSIAKSAGPPPVAATVHIYRGLMDQATTWRIRIDNPTNWAILSSGTTVSFVLSDQTRSHAVLLLNMVFTIMFLSVEARRTRYYDLWSSWVRLLETEYFAPILQDNAVTVNDTWQELIVRDLGYPHFKTTFWQMVGRRLRDNYMAIYLFLLLSWLVKLLQHGASELGSCVNNQTVICHATLGPIPGEWIFGTVFCFYAVLIVIMVLSYRTSEPSVEVLARERTLQKLVSPTQQPVSRRPWHPDIASSEDDDGRIIED